MPADPQHCCTCSSAPTCVCPGCGLWTEPCDKAGVVNCPWSSVVNLCCFDGCVFYSRSVDSKKQIIPAHYICSFQTKSNHINKQSAPLNGLSCESAHLLSPKQKSKGAKWNICSSYKYFSITRRQAAEEQVTFVQVEKATFPLLEVTNHSLVFSASQDKVLWCFCLRSPFHHRRCDQKCILVISSCFSSDVEK